MDMNEMIIDGLEDSSTEVFRVAPAGTYSATIEGVESAETGPNSKTPGAPMLKVTFKLNDEEYNNTIFCNYMLPIGWYRDTLDAEKVRMSLARIKQLQVACGLEPSNSLDTDAMMHQEVQVVVTTRDYQGQPQNDIREVLPIA